MRKLVLVLGLVCLCSSLALAQGKVSNEWACSKPAMMHSIEVGDQPNHAYVIDQIKCTSTKGEIAGVREKEGTGTEFADITGDKSSGHGIFVETLANGDKLTVAYQFTGSLKNGQMLTGSNKWSVTSATGKFKGIKYSGTCTAKGNADGTSTFSCNGTYSLPK